MLQIAMELSANNPMYSEIALKFTEHFLWIAAAMIGYLMKMAALITPETALTTESAYAAIQVEPHHPTST
jgi:hypothetical protein